MPPSFQFRLEPVRSLAERRETEAQSALAAALADESSARSALADADARSRAAVAALGTCLNAGSGGTVTGAQLRAQEVWIGSTLVHREAAALDVDRRVTETGARRGLLVEAARDHEVLERLRERRAAEHRATCARIEQEGLDEIALGLHRRRSA
ncbi:flagellar export protein FliJ [Patulibacter minatonensis]|uniref:flagellar export protein FliJ n=1 Tax=Patulibacter minatonensis TaxID=298163 RepID=UPI00047B21A8|nr:flagellar export protein FliJ [Patulibacter minatonensis]